MPGAGTKPKPMWVATIVTTEVYKSKVYVQARTALEAGQLICSGDYYTARRTQEKVLELEITDGPEKSTLAESLAKPE